MSCTLGYIRYAWIPEYHMQVTAHVLSDPLIYSPFPEYTQISINVKPKTWTLYLKGPDQNIWRRENTFKIYYLRITEAMRLQLRIICQKIITLHSSICALTPDPSLI